MTKDEMQAEITRLQYEVDAIPAIKAERDALAANHKECVRCLGEALQDTTKLAVERDALMSAAKLALEALDYFVGWEDVDDPEKPTRIAITALRQAGVQ